VLRIHLGHRSGACWAFLDLECIDWQVLENRWVHRKEHHGFGLQLGEEQGIPVVVDLVSCCSLTGCACEEFGVSPVAQTGRTCPGQLLIARSSSGFLETGVGHLAGSWLGFLHQKAL